MVTLTEEMIIARTKISNLESITKLNFCSRELSDVSILQKMRNVTVLSLSVNKIDSLEVFQFLTKLADLFLRKNEVADLNQVCYLQSLPELQNLWLQDNPCAANGEEYRLAVIRALPRLKKLDDAPVETSEIERAQKLGRPLAHPSTIEEVYSVSDDDEPYYQSHQNQEVQNGRCPPSEEEYPLESTYNPEPAVVMPPSVKEYNNVYEQINNSGYSNELEESHEDLEWKSSSKLYQNENDNRQQAPIYSKYEEDVATSQRPQNHRPQGMLPRSKTAIRPFQREVSSSSQPSSSYQIRQSFPGTDGELGHYNCSNYCPLSQGHRRPNERRTNVLNAVLCLIKELDYPNLEVVQMAVTCRMDDLCSGHLPLP